MYSSKLKQTKKIAVFLVIFFFIFQLISPSLLVKTVHAIDSETGEITGTTRDTIEQTTDTAQKTAEVVKTTVWDRITKGLMLSAAIVLRNALVYMSQKMAEQTVNWLATGDWGQDAMFYEQGWKKFSTDIIDSTTGVFLDNLRGELLEETGFDICEPALPSMKIEMMIGLDLPDVPEDPGMIDQKKPDCSLTKFTDNWEAFGENIKSNYDQFVDDPGAMSLAYLQDAGSLSFDPKHASMGVMLTLESELGNAQLEMVEAEEKQRAEGQGQKAKTSMSGDNVQAPAYSGKKQVEKEIEDVKDMPKTEAQASMAVIEEIPESVVAAFLSTFVSQAFSAAILKKMFDHLTNTSDSYNPKQYVFEPGKQIEKEIKQITKVSKISYSVGSKQIDFLTQFASCPQDRGLYNCVIDNDFAQAVRAATQDIPLSLKEAIDQGKVNGDLPLIPSTNGDNIDSDCFEKGWCYSNLVKLRIARIIPIGWEIAAQKVDEDQKDLTLKKAMDNFEVAGDFYHLVDPNWILQAPKARCEALAPGPILIGNGSDVRAENCSDVQSCLREDETGKCKAWGYCAAEKNIFRFGGEDCYGQYDSCQVLTDREGEEVKYLLKTVDKTGCDPNSVGCKWYSLAMSSNPDLKWQDNGADDKIFLNKTIDDFECSPQSEGCTRFIKTSAGLGTNLIANGGFELFEGELNDDISDKNLVFGWYKDDTLLDDSNFDLTSDSTAGLASLNLNGSDETIYSEKFNITPKPYTRYFALSLQAKKASDISALNVLFSPVSGENHPSSPVGLIYDSQTTSELAVNDWGNVYYIYEIKAAPGLEYIGGNFRFKFFFNNGGYLDNVLFEEIESPSIGDMHQYTEYASKNAEYVKQAPDYLQCYNVDSSFGEADLAELTQDGRPLNDIVILATDDVEKSATIKGCDGFAKLCTANDVGCDAYSVTDGNRVVNGVVSFNDYCPQQCNGYATFSQSKTYFADELFPEYLIPSTATQCTAAAAGCEEFTNLDEVSQGAEAKEYFSELRMCEQLPENVGNCENFYTWVAEEATGYQLKTYLLKADGSNPATVGVADAVACNKGIFDAQLNPDCRAFYNDAGHVSYRLYSQTITCSTDCHPYRRTLEYFDIDSGLTGQEQCEARVGEWSDSGECVFMAIPNEGKTCSAPEAGCKEYKGNYSGDEEIILQAAFIQDDLDKFETNGAIVTLPEGQVYSSDIVEPKEEYSSFSTGDYLLSFWVRKKNSADNVNLAVTINGESQLGISSDSIKEWSFYTYNFKVESSEVYADFPILVNSSVRAEFYTDNFQIKKVSDANYLIQDSWNTPAVCDQTLLNDDPLDQAQVGCREYQDRKGTIHYLKTFSGLCAADRVGCEALIDTRNNLDPFEKEYDQIVDPVVVCDSFPSLLQELFLTVTSYAQYLKTAIVTGVHSIDGDQCVAEIQKLDGSFENHPGDLSTICLALTGEGQEYYWDISSDSCKVKTAIISADNTIYLVNTEKNQCKKAEKGCTAVGLPEFEGGALNPDGWETYFYRLDPELFGSFSSPLCQSSAQGCEEYKDEKESTYFFKDPQGKLCEWRQGMVADESKEAWFKKGGDDVCLIEDTYGDGIDQLISNASPLYSGFVGECPETADKCTAFIDPTDDADDDGLGKAYYYINNELINRKCTGVNFKEGCVLFNDTSNPTLQYDAVKTKVKLEGEGNKLIPAVSANLIEEADSNAIIKVVRSRECGAWYDCKSSHSAWDPNLNKYQDVCDKVGVCTRLTAESDSPRCASFVNTATADNILTMNNPLQDKYDDRTIGWENFDYSGLAIPISAPIHLYDAFDISDDADNPDFRLVNYEQYHTGDYDSGESYCQLDSDCDSFCEVEVDENGNFIDKLTPTNNYFKDSCRCLSGTCVRANPSLVTMFKEASAPGCRAYPNDLAPFPAIVENTQAYKNANKITYNYRSFDDKKLNDEVVSSSMDRKDDSGCFYAKQSFGAGSIIKYFPLEYYGSTQAFTGFCQESPDILCSCDAPATDISSSGVGQVNIKTKTTCSSLACGDDLATEKTGMCMMKSEEDNKVDKYYGWQGYCLERDKSITINNTPGQHPCLTWYPSDSLAGLQDIKNNYEEAGYNPGDSSGSLFTISAKGWNKDWYNGALTEEKTVLSHGSKTDIDYVKVVNSWGTCKDGSLPPLKNWMACLHSGSEPKKSYMEGYYDAPSISVYEDEIIGVVISCVDTPWSDWCEASNGDSLWYDASQKYIDQSFPGKSLTPEDFGGFFIGKDADDYDGTSGPIYSEGQDSNSDPNRNKQGLYNYTTAKGSMDGYQFYKDNGTIAGIKSDISSDYIGPWTTWSYWQTVWSDAQTNTKNQRNPVSNGDEITTYGGRGKNTEAKQSHINRYYFGGDDYILPSNEPWDHYDVGYSNGKQTHLAPLFLGTGYSFSEKSCRNTLTNQTALDASVCSATTTLPPVNADLNAYKDSEGTFSDIVCGDSCVGTWDWSEEINDFDFFSESQASCVAVPQGEICANQQCRMANNVYHSGLADDDDSGLFQYYTNEDCLNSSAGWHCENEFDDDIGQCKYFSTEADTEGVLGTGLTTLVGYCDTSHGDGDGDYDNYFGVRVMFDDTGRYRGLWTSICDDSKGIGGQSFEVRFVFNEYADKLVQVNKQEGIYNENKAYTDKIYQRATATSVSDRKFHDANGGTGSQIIYESTDVPMGSVEGGDIGLINKMKLIPEIHNSVAEEVESPGGSQWVEANSPFGGKPWGCEGGETYMCDKVTASSALTVLKQYFAKVYTGWDWNLADSTYSEEEYGYYYDDSNNTDAKIPIIAAVVSTGKTDQEGNQIYAALPGKITINGKTEGNIEATDGNLDVSMKFYAWAPDDQMPLRKIKLKWGQDSSKVEVEGMFKNHKPRCQRSGGGDLGLCKDGDTYGIGVATFDNFGIIDGYACDHDFACEHLPGGETDCDSDSFGDRFGDVSSVDIATGIVSACEEAYYHFNTFYQCTESQRNGFSDCPDNDTDQTSPCKTTYNDKEVCRYIPKVQITDNWGWCNADTVWNDDGTGIVRMNGGGFDDDCDDISMYESYDGFIYVSP